MDIKKYEGIIPAFYACYAEDGSISPERVRALCEYLIQKGVRGLYVGGSSGECIYQTVAERKLVLETVMAVAKGRVTVIAHVACNSTMESCELAAHAESLGVDAIAAIPPIYFKLSDRAIAQYWNDISAAAPNTDFIIYNVPQLAGVALNVPLMKTMLENPRVIGVKNSSMPVLDIQNWRTTGAPVVMNGPDEQIFAGLMAGATGGIGGTYAVMPELYMYIYNAVKHGGDLVKALRVQDGVNDIITMLCSGQGCMYAMIKETLRVMGGPDCGSVRPPFFPIQPGDEKIAEKCAQMIRSLIASL